MIMKKTIIKLTKNQIKILADMCQNAVNAQYPNSKVKNQASLKFKSLLSSIENQAEKFELARTPKPPVVLTIS